MKRHGEVEAAAFGSGAEKRVAARPGKMEYAAGSRLDAVRRYEYGVRAESAGATEALALALAFDAAMSQEEKRSGRLAAGAVRSGEASGGGGSCV